MNNTEWIKEVAINELPVNYQEMAQIIGMKHTLKLAEYYGKQGFYFTGLDSLIARKKAEFIRKHFNGRNHCELARATGYSERWVYNILKNDNKDRQPDLFNEIETPLT